LNTPVRLDEYQFGALKLATTLYKFIHGASPIDIFLSHH